MAFTPPPLAPQRGDRATFSMRVDAFLTWLVQLIPQLNSFLGNISSLAAGGANAFSYAFIGGVQDMDPGAGRLRFFGPSQSTATILRMSTLPAGGGNILPLITSLLAGTSNIKASIRIQAVSDISRWIIFDVTGAAPASGYANLLGQVRVSSAEGDLFNDNDNLMVFIDRTGDKGDGGNTPTQQQIRDAVGILPVANGGTAANTIAGARANLSIDNVDNTSDANKPVSGPQAQALGLKFDKTGGLLTNHIDFINSKGIFMRDAAGNSRQIVKMDGNEVNFTVAGGGGINYYDQAGAVIVARLTNAGQFSAAQVTQTSDERLKTNWRAITDEQLDAIADMEKAGVFDWAAGGSSAGGSAQAIQQIIPEVVYETGGKLHVDYGGLNFAILQAQLRRMKQKGML